MQGEKMGNLISRSISKIITPFKPLIIQICEVESAIAKRWAASAHKRLFLASWKISKNPEFFDHHLDLYYQWQKTRASWWLKRGVFGSLALKRNGDVLELACGDGFNAKNFYSYVAKSVVACDFDKDAIATATRKNKAENVSFLLRDIRNAMPEGSFDNIVWDAAIEHFTPDEISLIMKNI